MRTAPDSVNMSDLRQAVSHLSERAQKIVALHYDKGLEFSEIDYVLSLPVGFSKRAHANILKAIRVYLDA